MRILFCVIFIGSVAFSNYDDQYNDYYESGLNLDDGASQQYSDPRGEGLVKRLVDATKLAYEQKNPLLNSYQRASESLIQHLTVQPRMKIANPRNPPKPHPAYINLLDTLVKNFYDNLGGKAGIDKLNMVFRMASPFAEAAKLDLLKEDYLEALARVRDKYGLPSMYNLSPVTKPQLALVIQPVPVLVPTPNVPQTPSTPVSGSNTGLIKQHLMSGLSTSNDPRIPQYLSPNTYENALAAFTQLLKSLCNSRDPQASLVIAKAIKDMDPKLVGNAAAVTKLRTAYWAAYNAGGGPGCLLPIMPIALTWEITSLLASSQPYIDTK